EDDHGRDGDYQEGEENAETVDAHAVGEGQAGRLRHVPGRNQSGRCAGEGDHAEGLLALLFIDQRLENHHQNAENREHQFGQYADVVSALRDGLHLSKKHGHWDTTLLRTCAKGVKAACTAGSIAASHIMGATPMTRAAMAQGQMAAFSKPNRSATESFLGFVTFP